jgi:hypothetical protein
VSARGRGGGYKAAKSYRHIVVILWNMIDLENNPRVAVGARDAVPGGGMGGAVAVEDLDVDRFPGDVDRFPVVNV